MKVTRFADFTEEELEKLQGAGTILGSFAKAAANGEFDLLTQDALSLLEALKDVIDRIIGE